MDETLQHGRCPACQTPITGLGRLARLSTANITSFQQFTAAKPPGPLPVGTVGVDWIALPCWHPLTSSTEALWDTAIDLGWSETVAKKISAPLSGQVAA